MALAGLFLVAGGKALAVLGLALATWTGVATFPGTGRPGAAVPPPPRHVLAAGAGLPRAAYGMTLAHLGLAITVAGISAAAFESERIEVLHQGQSVAIAGYELRLADVTRRQGPNFTADDARIVRCCARRARRHHAPAAPVLPAAEPDHRAETAIRSNLLADLYVALGDPDGAGGWTVRAYYKPLGALDLARRHRHAAAGGAVSLSDRRWRVGVAARSPRRGAVAA